MIARHPPPRGGEQELYTYSPVTGDSAVAGFFATQLQPADSTTAFTIGGREWEITASALPAYMADKLPVVALLILVTGLFFAVGTTAWLVLNQIHADRIRAGEETREALENQLIRAQKLEAIGHLVGGIAHDFNNVLTSIIGYAELASDEVKGNGPLGHYLRIILQSSEKGKGLIQKLLSFSRNEPTRPKPRILQPLVENIMAMLQPVMTSRVHMNFTADPVLPLVSIDSTSFDQLLANLCVNARDAITGAGHIHIDLRQARDPGTPCLSCKEAGKGTGLGLPIINHVTHGCGGHILADSIPGQGTTFKLLFPPAELPAGFEASKAA